MRYHHSCFGQNFNRIYERQGKVSYDRPLTVQMENEAVTLEVIFYVHANPLKSKMPTRQSRNYYYSTHQLYAYGKRAPWMKHVKFAPCYLRLGKTPEQRQKKYRKLFDAYLRRKGLLEKAYSILKKFHVSSL